MIVHTFGEPLFHTETDVAALAYAPDGNLWSVEENGVLRQWSPEGRILQRFFLSDLETLWAFSFDASLIASGSDTIMLWESASGSVLANIEAPSWVSALVFSPDGKKLASGHENGFVCIWDVESGEALATVQAHPVQVSALAFRADGTQIASAGEDRQIRVWNTSDLAAIETLTGHTDRIPSLAWHPTENYLVSAGWDTTARLWRLPHTDPLMLLNTHAEQVLTLAFNPKSGLLAVADTDSAIHIWNDPLGARVQFVLHGHEDEIRTLVFSLDGRYLASAGADAVIRVWDAQTGRLISGVTHHHRNLIALTDEKIASSGGSRVQVWDIVTGTSLSGYESGEVLAVATSPDGKWLATTDHTPEVQVWDITTGSLNRRCVHTKGPILAPTFSADSTLLGTASVSDGLVWVWDLTKEEAILVVPEAAESSKPEAVAFHPNGKWFACGGLDYLSTAGNDGVVCIWDMLERDKVFTLTGGVRDLAFDATGRYLAGASLRQSVYLWDLESQKLVFELVPHPDDVLAVAFTPDGNWLVSACADGTIRVWNVLSGKLQIARQFDTIPQSLAFSRDGQWLYSGNLNTTVFRIDFRRLVED